MPAVTAPVRALLDRLAQGGFRLTPMLSYRGVVSVAFDNQRPLDDGALFGAVAVSTKTGKFVRAHLWSGGHEHPYRLLAEFRGAVEQSLGDVPL